MYCIQPQVFYVDEENEQTAFKQLIKVGLLYLERSVHDGLTNYRVFGVSKYVQVIEWQCRMV